MKLVVVLLLVGIVTVSCLPKRGRGGGKGKGKGPKWCTKNDGVDWDQGCVCKDESTCESFEDCQDNCGKRSENPVVSCPCSDGTEWKKPETPCDGGRKWYRDVESCTCDGETYEGKDAKRNCGRKGEKVDECTCSDGSIWTPSDDEEEEERYEE